MIRVCSSCGSKNRVPVERLVSNGRCGRCKATLPALAEPIDVPDEATFKRVVEDSVVPVLVDFWAPWCGPCRMVAPEVQRAAAELSGRAVVLKVNTEALPGLAARYRISAIPNFMVFRLGQPVFQQAGAVSHQQMVRWAANAAAAAA